MMQLMDSPTGITGPINFGNPQEFTMLELAEKVLRKVGGALEDQLPAAAGRRSETAAAGHHEGAQSVRLAAGREPRRRAGADHRLLSAKPLAQ